MTRKTSSKYTYFIQPQSGVAVKIGVSSNPEHRIKELQTGHHEPLHIAAVLKGDREREFHVRFSGLRMRGEWFRATSELSEYLHAQGAKFPSDGNRVSVEQVCHVHQPVEERECDEVIEMGGEEERELMYSNPYTPCKDCAGEEPGVIRWEPDEDEDESECWDFCDCNYTCWDTFAMSLLDRRIINRVGLNVDASIMWVVMKDINSGVRVDEFNEILVELWFMRDVQWRVHISFGLPWGTDQQVIHDAQSVAIHPDFRLAHYSYSINMTDSLRRWLGREGGDV